MIEKKSAYRIHEKTIKPLFRDKEYGLISDLMHQNPKIKDYMNDSEIRVMMDYYERLLYGAKEGLVKVLNQIEGKR